MGRSNIGRTAGAPWAPAVAALGLAAFLGACAPADRREDASPPADTVRTVVDSILPIEEEIRRFRATLEGEAPERLAGGAPSRDALVEGFVAAVESADTAALRAMLLTRAEFAWLYYPHTRFTSPPYTLAPGLLWFQIENGTSRGFHRLMDRMGGRPVHANGYGCGDAPLVEGPNRVWEECAVRLEPPGGEARTLRLFGSILERDGTFKFVSYSNGF